MPRSSIRDIILGPHVKFHNNRSIYFNRENRSLLTDTQRHTHAQI